MISCARVWDLADVNEPDLAVQVRATQFDAINVEACTE